MSTIYAVGNMVTFHEKNIEGLMKYDGKVGKITQVDESVEPWSYFVTWELPMSDHSDGGHIGIWTLGHKLTPRTTLADVMASPEVKVGRAEVTIPANATPDELRAIIEACSNDLAEVKQQSESRLTTLQREQNRVSELQGRYVRHMQHWETTLRQAKEDQSWCDEGTDEVIDTLNEGFGGAWTIERYGKRRRKAKVRVTREVAVDMEVWVSEDDYESDLEHDPDYWYTSEDGDECVGEDGCDAALDEEIVNSGYDTEDREFVRWID